MNWISWFGLGIVLLLLIPNAVYAAANKNTQPPRTSRILGLAEQAGRYGCMFLMIFHAGLTEFGFASAEGFTRGWPAPVRCSYCTGYSGCCISAPRSPGTRCRWLCCPA